jgi:hypothetical protein
MKNIVQQLDDVNARLIQFQYGKNQSNESIKLATPTYEGDLGNRIPFYIQLPPIRPYGYYGVPRLDKYHTEEQINFITLPLDEEHMALFKQIDDYVGGVMFKQQYLDKDWKNYAYFPLVRRPQNKPSYVKIKIDKSKLDVLANKEKVDIITTDDLALYINNSIITCIVHVNLLWVQSPDLVDPKYGLTLKAIKIMSQGDVHDHSYIDFVS